MSVISKRQFTDPGAQLPMFVEVDDLIDGFHKNDSDETGSWSPREQWERPSERERFFTNKGESLREAKLRSAKHRLKNWELPDGSPYDIDAGRQSGALPPVDVYRSNYHKGEAVLDNGHHRLALHEKRKHETGRDQYVAVRWAL